MTNTQGGRVMSTELRASFCRYNGIALTPPPPLSISNASQSVTVPEATAHVGYTTRDPGPRKLPFTWLAAPLQTYLWTVQEDG